MLAWGFNSLAGYPIGAFADASGERAALLVMGICVIGVTGLTFAAYQAVSRQPSARRATMAAQVEASGTPNRS